MIGSGIYGMSNPKYTDKGRIHLLPDAFESEEELAKTLYHEKTHIEQFIQYGHEYVMNNRDRFEDLSESLEDTYFLKKEWLKT